MCAVEHRRASLSDHDIYVPERVGDRIDYRRMTRNPELDYLNSVKPPKDVFFPQTEKMFDFTVSGSRITGLTETPLPHRPILLFGSRPCDARAAAMLDRVFGWDYLDPYYLERKRRAVVVSIACREPEDSCFCTSMGGNPGSTEGSDLLLTDLGDRYLVEVITDKGATVMERGGDLFRNAEETDLEAAARVTEEAESAITRHMNLDGVKEALERAFDSSYWEEFANRCIGCGICTLLCPTCHCFDINDVVSRGRAWRERTWDTCQDAYYSVHASGHNPRPGQSSRQRNRIYHKFLYMDRNLGVIGCVGCGRCIRGCPVNIDIIEVVEGVREAVE